MTKILFIHTTAMWYRRPFFKRLSEIYELNYVFTHIQVSKDVYGVELSPSYIEGLEGVRYKSPKNYAGIAFGVIREAMGDYDVLVGGSWDTPAELLETCFFFTIAKLRKKQFVVWREDWNWKEKSFKRKLISPIVNFILKNSDTILVPGSRHKEYALSLGASPNKVFIMHNAYNINVGAKDWTTKEKLKEELIGAGGKIVLYVGRFIELKGVQYLIPAFAKLIEEKDNAILVLVGDGDYKNVLEKLCKKFSIENKVRFIDWVNNENLAPYYLLCNLFVLPSITIHATAEAWGLVLNEAMQFGKPIITTDAVGAAFDLVKDGENGFVVPERDADALYESMKKILSDPELERRMGEESKKIIEQEFRLEDMVNGFKNAIEYLKQSGGT